MIRRLEVAILRVPCRVCRVTLEFDQCSGRRATCGPAEPSRSSEPCPNGNADNARSAKSQGRRVTQQPAKFSVYRELDANERRLRTCCQIAHCHRLSSPSKVMLIPGVLQWQFHERYVEADYSIMCLIDEPDSNRSHQRREQDFRDGDCCDLPSGIRPS